MANRRWISAGCMSGLLAIWVAPVHSQDRLSPPQDSSPFITEPKKVLKDATEGLPYKYRISAYGGKRPYQWHIKDKTLAPPGIDIDPLTGTLQGKPGAGSSKQSPYTFTVIVANANHEDDMDERTFTIAVKKATVFDTLSDAGLKLRERAQVDDDGSGSGPAKFNFTHSIHGSNDYTTDAALLYSKDLSSHRWGHFELVDFRPSIEAHLSTGSVDGEQSVSARVGLSSQVVFDAPFSLSCETSLLYETDQKFKDQRVGPELNIAPVLPTLGAGRTVTIVPDGTDSAVTLRWRPSLGAALGVPIRQSDPTADDDTIERIYAKLRVDLDCPILSDLLGIEGVNFFCQLEGYRVFAEDDPSKGNHGFIEAGMSLAFTDNVSLESGFKRGETAPNFTRKVNQLYVALGVKF